MSSAYLSSPLGFIEVRGDEQTITSIKFNEGGNASSKSSGIVEECRRQLQEFFKGKRRQFNLPLNPEGTEFQKKVWSIVKEAPFGETITYSSIAVKLGDVKLTRAVGYANGQNPILLLIPCHRVIATDGSLAGYAAGIDRKRWLLDYESNVVSRQLQLL